MKRVLPFAIALVIILAAWIQAPAQGGGKEWLTDMDRAMQQAAAENKDLLLDFTGSDWCGWCIRLNEEVFSKPEFERVKEHFVLVELDFPQDKSKISPETREQNDQWQQKLAVEGFPTIFLTDAQGRPYAMTGYRDGGAATYVEHLAELRRVRELRDKAFAAAKEAQGTEQAKHLHEGLSAMRGDFVISNYRDEVEKIIALDAQNEAGLKEKYQYMLAEADARQKMQELQQKLYEAMAQGEKGAEEAIELLETELAAAGDNHALRRQIQMMRINFLPHADRFDEAVAVVDELLADEHTAEDEKLNLGVQKGYMLVQAGKTKEAVEQFDKLIDQVDSANIKGSLLFTKAQVLQAAGNNEEALQAFTQLSESGEKGSEVWIYGQQYRGNLLEAMGRTKEALDVFEELLSAEELQMPLRIGALSHKAALLLATGDKAQAVTVARQAKELITAVGDDEFSQFWLTEAEQRIEAVLQEAGGK